MLSLARRATRLSRSFHATRAAQVITRLAMPAMSPTMTEGAIVKWNYKVGEAFSAGDVLLGIETDKAAIEVEAQDDGIMGKILVEEGTSGVAVGKVIALLAEEGDDITNLELPADVSSLEAAPTSLPPVLQAPTPTPSVPTPPTPQAAVPVPAAALTAKVEHHPKHSSPLLPSVLRLLALNQIKDPSIITPTGRHGMLTKGDVLAFLGRIVQPSTPVPAVTKAAKAPEAKQAPAPAVAVDVGGQDVRRLILAGLSRGSRLAPAPLPSTLDFDDILDDYLPRSTGSTGKRAPVGTTKKVESMDSLLDL